MAIVKTFFYLLIYPGVLFLFVYALFCEWFDRKAYARLQNRRGPLHTGKAGILQPLADYIKLFSKEEIIPEKADKIMFTLLPVFGLAIVLTSAMYLPIWNYSTTKIGFNSFPGDIIVLIYLLSLPTIILFLAGWHSTNFFSEIGGVRVVTMFFGYEIPLLLSVLSPAILAGSWRLSVIAQFFQSNPGLLIVNIIGFFIALIALQAKLERTPFDIPHAETEIVGGTFAEYTGRNLAFFRLMTDIELIVGSGLIATVFLGGFPGGVVSSFIWFIIKTLFVIFLLSVMKSAFSRLRIDQMVKLSWYILAPLGIFQILITLLVKGVIR
jgi:NADH-quinone oxidoreductase subunit H